MNSLTLKSLLAATLLAGAASAVPAQELKIGYVNSDRVLRDAAPAKAAQAKLEAEFGKRFTLGLNGEVGYGDGLGGRPFPLFKNFYGGGLGSVRGFDQGSLGPVDVTGAYIGGNRKMNVNAEFYVPVPGSGNDRTLRLFGYLDAGNVWGEDESIEFDDLRASVGVGLSWVSPVGPLKISYGQPIHKFSQDRIQKFQFQIGTAF